MTQIFPYQTLKSYDAFELRLYPAATLISSVAPQIFPEIGQSAEPLNHYRCGHNRTGQTIPQLAPTLISPAGDNDNVYLLQYFLPHTLTVSTAPLPENDAATLLTVPPRKIAALRYSGVWSQDRFVGRALKLQQAVLSAELQPQGAAIAARYDGAVWPPFFMRRNEVWLEVA